MGAKTSEDDIPGGNGRQSPSPAICSTGGQPRGTHLSRDGDGCLGDKGGDDDDDDDDEVGPGPLTGEGGKKKRKRKPRSKKKKAVAQSSPPRVPLSDLFKSGEYPPGEFQEYSEDFNLNRTTAAEVRYNGRKHLEDPTFLNDYRKAAEVHRQVRHWVQEHAKPGSSVSELATGIEDGVRALLGNQGIEPGDNIKAGMGFPTGICINHQVAHYTPNPGQKDVVLQHHDTVKFDYGVQINGWIVDSAFTIAFDPMHDTLLTAVKDATNSGIKASGIDVRICDVSAAIHETMESYEVEYGGKTFPVKPVRNISAHNIQHYRIHGGKSIPFVRNSDQTKMEEGEVFAIETFGTTGRGWLRDDVGIYGYGLQHDAPSQVSLPLVSATRLHKLIKEQFGTIVFCRRYLERLGVERYLAGLNCLVSHGVLEAYAPLADIQGSYSAQFEHTFLMRESCKEILSRGSDY
ncbi:peptidase M24, structural domain-containing protein [Stachybotrys elegans]|uniref:Methionine aminopeptidase 2 n=1 Tax=Stachybotrys elegans TaxID=80388 RepID=A0A8K0WR32_9HYPO|nr:peptidase M24, structural domain-containing protein [Stachybotrys elegans]